MPPLGSPERRCRRSKFGLHVLAGSPGSQHPLMDSGVALCDAHLHDPAYTARLQGDDFSTERWVRITYKDSAFYCKPAKALSNEGIVIGTRISERLSEPLPFNVERLPRLRIASEVCLSVTSIRAVHLEQPPKILDAADQHLIHAQLLDHPVSQSMNYRLCIRLSSSHWFYIDMAMRECPSKLCVITASSLLHFDYQPRLARPLPAYLVDYFRETEAYRSLTECLSANKAGGGLALLTGPREVGKSTLARIFSDAHNLELIEVFCGIIKSDTVDETEHELMRLFSEAPAKALLLIHDIEKIANDRRHRTASVACGLLQKHARRCLIFTSECPSAIHGSLLSVLPSIAVEPPKALDRLRFVKLLLPSPCPLDEAQLAELANKTNGFLFHDMQQLVRLASADGPVTCQTLLQHHSSIAPSLLHDHRVPVQVGVTWSDIAGIDEVRDKIRRLIENPLKKAEAYKALGLKPPKGILLHGPPGCSKTTIAKAIANAGNYAFYSISGASVYSAYVGESERIVRETFASARATSPSVIFVDEVDTIVGKRSMAGGAGADVVQERILSTFLNEMDGVEEPPGDVIVLAATNRLWAIDDAILRAGRFDYIVEIPLPDAKGRRDILALKTRQVPLACDASLQQVADMTEGYSGADLESLVREACMAAIRDGADVLSTACFEAALRSMRSARLNPPRSRTGRPS